MINIGLTEPVSVTRFSLASARDAVLSGGMALRLLAATGLGGLVGLEREWRHKPSGLRTNMLICLGSALFTMLSVVIAGDGSPNKGQIASNIVQGIGFLGAGLILHSKSRVLGLTTAATVWVVAAIGMACGAGLFMEALGATVIVLLALQVVGLAEEKSRWKRYPMIYEVRGSDQNRIYVAILSVLDRMGIRLSVLERESVAGLQRVAFAVMADRRTHQRLREELHASDAADQVVAFRDLDDE